MNIALITGSAGLIGSEAAAFYSSKFDLIVGIDNNLRHVFSVMMRPQTGIITAYKKVILIIRDITKQTYAQQMS